MAYGYDKCFHCQAKTMNWPPGPQSVRELMQWTKHNAGCLMEISQCRENFSKLLNHQIEIHEAYAGCGTGGVTMHQQFKRMLRRGLREYVT